MRTTSKERILARIDNNDIKAFLNHFDDVKWEQAFHSVKLGTRNINRDRLVIGMRACDITFKKLARKLLEMKFPESKLIELENRYYQADDIGFAIEVLDEGIDLRVYFEIKYTDSKWYKVKAERMKNKDYYTMPLFIGYKWMHNNPKIIISQYDYLQFLDGDSTIKRLKDISSYLPNCIIKALSGKKEEDIRNYVVMEVKDNDSKRFSYDIRFDANKIYLKEFSAKEIMDNFKVNIDALKDFNTLSIGHISGGKDKNGEDFLTLYFVV